MFVTGLNLTKLWKNKSNSMKISMKTLTLLNLKKKNILFNLIQFRNLNLNAIQGIWIQFKLGPNYENSNLNLISTKSIQNSHHFIVIGNVKKCNAQVLVQTK